MRVSAAVRVNASARITINSTAGLSACVVSVSGGAIAIHFRIQPGLYMMRSWVHVEFRVQDLGLRVEGLGFRV